MDEYIAHFPSVADRDLSLCLNNGVAYQTDMVVSASYDADYFNKCAGYENQDIALKINAGRIAMVNGFVGEHCKVLDVGVGSGEFVKKRPHTYGFDVNPVAVTWLKKWGLYSSAFSEFVAFTFWDVIEHVPSPSSYFKYMQMGSYVFASIPVFPDLSKIRLSKHYRPGEHLYYFTEDGFVNWMELYGYHLIDRQDYETAAGRDSILSFAFRLRWL